MLLNRSISTDEFDRLHINRRMMNRVLPDHAMAILLESAGAAMGSDTGCVNECIRSEAVQLDVASAAAISLEI